MENIDCTYLIVIDFFVSQALTTIPLQNKNNINVLSAGPMTLRKQTSHREIKLSITFSLQVVIFMQETIFQAQQVEPKIITIQWVFSIFR